MLQGQVRVDKYNEPFWTALREQQLRMPRCTQCGRIQFPMGPCCSHCLGEGFDWVALTGKGKVYAFVIYHHAFHPSLKDKLPYNVAEIALDEGVTLISNVVGIPDEQLHNEMRVRARFDRIDDTLTLLRFEPDVAEDMQ